MTKYFSIAAVCIKIVIQSCFFLNFIIDIFLGIKANITNVSIATVYINIVIQS